MKTTPHNDRQHNIRNGVVAWVGLCKRWKTEGKITDEDYMLALIEARKILGEPKNQIKEKKDENISDHRLNPASDCLHGNLPPKDSPN